MPDTNDINRLVEEYKQKVREAEEMMNNIRRESQPKIQSYVNELISRGNNLRTTNNNINRLEQELKDARALYATQSIELKKYYDDAMNDLKIPEIQKMLNDAIAERDPELLSILNEKAEKTRQQVTRYLRRQANLIDPVTGKTYASWAEADRAYGFEIGGDSAKRVFLRNRDYPLVELTDQTVTAINDCVNTPGCVESTIDSFIKDVNEKKIANDDTNALMDHIFQYLKEHSKENKEENNE